MAIKAVTKAKRLTKAEGDLAAHDLVTANLQTKLEGRKAQRKVLEHDIKVLKLTRTVDGDPTEAGE